MTEQPLGKGTLEGMCVWERGSGVWGWGRAGFLGPKFSLGLEAVSF